LLLSGNLVERASDYSEVRKYRVRVEKATNTYYRVYLESGRNQSLKA
jgi:hypothetical protein